MYVSMYTYMYVYRCISRATNHQAARVRQVRIRATERLSKLLRPHELMSSSRPLTILAGDRHDHLQHIKKIKVNSLSYNWVGGQGGHLLTAFALSPEKHNLPTHDPKTNDPTTHDPKTNDPTIRDPKTNVPKEAGVREAKSREARVREVRSRDAGFREARSQASKMQ